MGRHRRIHQLYRSREYGFDINAHDVPCMVASEQNEETDSYRGAMYNSNISRGTLHYPQFHEMRYVPVTLKSYYLSC